MAWRQKSSLEIPLVPEHIVRAETAKHNGEADKVRTTTLPDTTYLGIRLISRYGKHYEMDVMALVVQLLSPVSRSLITGLFCDSKAEACYSVGVRSDVQSVIEPLAREVQRCIMAAGGGHNGLYFNVMPPGETHPIYGECILDLGADWDEVLDA